MTVPAAPTLQTDLDELVRTPPRRPRSVRRTSTIDMFWPSGPQGSLVLVGQARDLLTGADTDTMTVLGQDASRTVVRTDRTVGSVWSRPARTGLSQLVGGPAISGLRRRLVAAVPDPADTGRPLFLLLDDIPGATIVSDFALREWLAADPVQLATVLTPPRRVLGICSGFRPGSSGVDAEGFSTARHHTREVELLTRPDDPHGWHQIEETTRMSMRRARRIDVWVGDTIEVDSMFQDSASSRVGRRVAIHEYRVRATADRDTGRLLSVDARPGNLPYDECPMAAANATRLVGSELGELRRQVTSELKGTAGCTHLTDALRALAEVPVLLGHLSPASGPTG